MKKKLALILVMVMVIGTLAGCSKPVTPGVDGGDVGDKNKDRLVVLNLGIQPKSWDPQKNNNTEGAHVIANLFEGLFVDTAEGVVAAGMESYETRANAAGEENTIYTFKLKQGIKWSDGKDVTANDYAYAWVRACSSELASGSAPLVTMYVKGGLEYFEGTGKKEDVAVKALDDYTLEVELTAPISYFFDLLSLNVYAPTRSDIIEASGEGWDKDVAKCISNGPFKLSEYKVGSHLTIVKNEHYWDADNVKIGGVKYLFLEELTTALQAYQKGEIQILDQVPPEEIPVLQAEDPNFSIMASVGTEFYSFNVDKAPTDNVKVREALSIAIDRKSIVEQVTRGGEMPATSMLPPVLTKTDGKSFRQLDANGNPKPEFGIDPNQAQVEKAKALLVEAGYPEGKGMPVVDIVFNSNATKQKIAEAIQQMWKAIGVESTLRGEDWAVFGKTRNSGNFGVNRGGWSGDYADPITMLEIFQSSSPVNATLWRWQAYSETPEDITMNPKNKEYDEIIQKIMRTSGEEKDNFINQAEKIVCEEERIIIPLYYFTNKQIIDSAVIEGATKTRMGAWQLKNTVWVD